MGYENGTPMKPRGGKNPSKATNSSHSDGFLDQFNGNSRILKWRYWTIIRPYFVGIFPYIGLKNRQKISGIGTSNFYRFLLHGHGSMLEFGMYLVTCSPARQVDHMGMGQNPGT